MVENIIKGKVYVLGDKINTDHMIPADRLTWDPSIPDERLKLGSYAFDGLPEDIKKKQPFITEEERESIGNGKAKAKYNNIIGGKGFGCGSSREHAANALGAAGIEIVVAKGYARIFFENCVATGEILPATSLEDITDKFKTGDDVKIDLDTLTVYNDSTGGEFKLGPLGYILPMVKAGGLFAYARQKGLIDPRPEE